MLTNITSTVVIIAGSEGLIPTAQDSLKRVIDSRRRPRNRQRIVNRIDSSASGFLFLDDLLVPIPLPEL